MAGSDVRKPEFRTMNAYGFTFIIAVKVLFVSGKGNVRPPLDLKG